MRFLKIFAVVTVLVILFLSLGGWMLFDFSRHFYLSALMCGLIASLVIFCFVKQDDRLERLEKELEALKREENSETAEK